LYGGHRGTPARRRETTSLWSGEDGRGLLQTPQQDRSRRCAGISEGRARQAQSLGRRPLALREDLPCHQRDAPLPGGYRMNNVAASVRARLLNVAKAQGVDFNQVLVRFALERILYRLSQSEHADHFLLKGALLFTLWYDMPHRTTRDADLLGFGASDLESVTQTFRDIASVAVDDGIVFDPASVAAEEIRKDAGYVGARIFISGELARARCKTQIDIGFGDAVTPGPVDATYPVLLADLPAPRLRTY